MCQPRRGDIFDSTKPITRNADTEQFLILTFSIGRMTDNLHRRGMTRQWCNGRTNGGRTIEFRGWPVIATPAWRRQLGYMVTAPSQPHLTARCWAPCWLTGTDGETALRRAGSVNSQSSACSKSPNGLRPLRRYDLDFQVAAERGVRNIKVMLDN